MKAEKKKGDYIIAGGDSFFFHAMDDVNKSL